MPKTLSTSAKALLSKGIARQFFRIYVGGTLCNPYIKSYSYSSSIDSGGQATVLLINNAVTLAFEVGDTVVIQEGVSTSELFDRFSGKIDKKAPQVAGGLIEYELTCYDAVKALSDLDIEINLSASTTTISNETLHVSFTEGDTFTNYFTGKISTVNTTTVVYSGDNNESCLHTEDGFQYLYNLTKGSCRLILAYNKSTNTITTETSTDSWAANDLITNKIYHNLFKTTFPGLDTNYIVIRSIKNPNLDQELEYPDLSHKTIYPDTGEILFDTPLMLRDFTIKIDYRYFNGDLYVEDAIYSILSATDGRGEAVVGDKYLLTAAYQSIEGAGVKDQLVGAGTNWYTKYNNITTALSTSDFTVVGSTLVTPSAEDKRLGRFRTAGSATSVRCDYNYVFKTVQSTNQLIPYAYFSTRTTKSRLDAAQLILSKTITPNYRFFTYGTFHLFCNYLTQNPHAAPADLQVYNTKTLQFFSESDVYTRAQLFAKNVNPTSAMADSFIIRNTGGLEFVEKEVLVYNGADPNTDYVEFQTLKTIINTQTDYMPILYINDNPVSSESTIQVGYDDITDVNRDSFFSYREGDWFFKQRKGDFSLPPSGATSEWEFVVRFYNSDGFVIPCSVAFVPNEPSTVRTSLSTVEVKAIASATYFYKLFVDWYCTGNKVYASKSLVHYQLYFHQGKYYPIYDVVTLSYYFSSYSASGTNQNSILCDLNPYTVVQKCSYTGGTDLTDTVFLTIVLSGLKSIDELHITGGMFYPDGFTSKYGRGYDVDQVLTIRSSETPIFAGQLYTTINSVDTTIVVNNTVNLSSLEVDDYIWIENEKIQVRTITALENPQRTSLLVYRGMGSTTAKAHVADRGDVFWGFEGNTAVYQDTTFIYINSDLEAFSLSSSESKVITKEVLGDSFSAACFQITINTAATKEFYIGDVVKTGQLVSISEFLLYSDSYLVAESKLTSAGTFPDVADPLDLYGKYGDRVFKKEFGENSYFTLLELQNAAYNILLSNYKNQSQVTIEEVWLPSVQLGQTLKVIDTVQGGDLTTGVDYFVTGFSGNNSGGRGSHSIQAAKYEE